MNNRVRSARLESVGLALASLGLGAYLASSASGTMLQLAMFSFPPASLWITVRREASVDSRTADSRNPELPLFTATRTVTLEEQCDLLSHAS